ncbi:MAG: alpha-mannosidase [Armatimonadetes bacterium]|nr:alpha-mannosidase [Armatimonadota bacterium]
MPGTRPTLHAIGNAHIDPVWLWRWPEGLETTRATFRSALDRMEEFPDFIFTGSSAAFYAMLARTDPDMLDEIRQRVREGRWEIVGGWWIQPDANIPCGESLVRQALYGQRFFEKELGVRASVGYNPDTFGHAGSLPQILRQAGLDSYVFMRPGPHEKDLPGNLFLWQSPDGSQALACRLSRAYCTWSDDLTEHVLANHAARPGYVSDYTVFYGVGNHGGGPTVRNIESLLEIAGKEGMPFVRLSRLKDYFASVRQEMAQGAAVPVVADDLQHHARGCYTAHSEVKRQNRRVEHLLMAAERFASVAWLSLARPYPQDSLAEAWESLLFNQFHDIMAGTSLPEGYEDARDLFGHAATLGSRALHYSLQSLTGQIDTRGEGSALAVFNPLPWPVTVPVEIERGSASVCDAGGHPVLAQSVQPTTTAGQSRSCFTARLPALGYRLFRQGVAKPVPEPAGMLSAGPHFLENDFWRLEADPATGHLIRLYDKRSQVETLAAPGNTCIVIDDPSDTWSHDVSSFRSEIGRFGEANIAIEEEGPVRACLRIETRWGRSQATQRLYLYRDLDIIECRLTANWQEERKMLKLAFPLRLEEPEATYDIAYGHIRRPANGEEEPGQQWLDLSGCTRTDGGERIPYGVALLNDCKYGFDALAAEMRMSLLRSPACAHHDPSALDPDRRYAYLDQGLQTITYRLVPHRGGWQEAAIPRRAWELNVLPLWVNEYAHSGPMPAECAFLDAEPDNILLSVLKKAEEGEAIIIRGYETAGRRSQATVHLPCLHLSWQAVFEPHEIKSWRVSRENGSEVEEVNLLEERKGT